LRGGVDVGSVMITESSVLQAETGFIFCKGRSNQITKMAVVLNTPVGFLIFFPEGTTL
jgi:hypothetical protein